MKAPKVTKTMENEETEPVTIYVDSQAFLKAIAFPTINRDEVRLWETQKLLLDIAGYLVNVILKDTRCRRIGKERRTVKSATS